MQGRYDAIIIGAGHNGLVTACYLARAGKKVLILERRHVVGGACVTEEVFPGFKVSTAAYVNSLFRKEIIRDLKLHDHGFALLERNPSSFSPFLDGRYLMMGADREKMVNLDHPTKLKFPLNADQIQRAIYIQKLDYLYIDAINEHLGQERSGLGRDERTRHALSPLAVIAQNSACTIHGNFHERRDGE